MAAATMTKNVLHPIQVDNNLPPSPTTAIRQTISSSCCISSAGGGAMRGAGGPKWQQQGPAPAAPAGPSTGSSSPGASTEHRRDSAEEDEQPRPKMEKRDVTEEGAAGGKTLCRQLSIQEQEAIKELRRRLQGTAPAEQLQDHLLLQWLTARNFSLDKAESMFRKSQEWREQLDVAHVLEWQAPEVLRKYVALGWVGFDRYGCPVLIIPHGREDTRGLIQSAKLHDSLRYTVQTLERSKVLMAEESQRRGCSPITQQTCIFDLDGFTISNFTYKPVLDFITATMQVYEANYPELLRVAYVVNAPKIFTMAYALIKNFLHEATIKKVQIFGRTGWKEVLLKDIDPAVLPKHWGGDRVDPDGNEMCPSVVCLGGPVPKSYYLKNIQKENRRNLTTITVGQGMMETVKIEVTEPNSVLRWEFSTEDYDIGFSVELEGSPEPLLPTERFSSHMGPEDGRLVCVTPGTYLVNFDNTFSYMRSKKVMYTIDVLRPQPGSKEE